MEERGWWRLRYIINDRLHFLTTLETDEGYTCWRTCGVQCSKGLGRSLLSKLTHETVMR